MLDGYDALLIPLTTLAISGGFAIWLYYSTRQFWRTALDNALARAGRFLMRQWRRSNDSRRMRQRVIAHEL